MKSIKSKELKRMGYVCVDLAVERGELSFEEPGWAPQLLDVLNDAVLALHGRLYRTHRTLGSTTWTRTWREAALVTGMALWFKQNTVMEPQQVQDMSDFLTKNLVMVSHELP